MSKAAKNDKREIDVLREYEGDYLHNDKLEDLIGRDEFDFDWTTTEPTPSKCVFCNADWSPEMVQLYIGSGYCETCEDSQDVTLIACHACGKVVYRK